MKRARGVLVFVLVIVLLLSILSAITNDPK